MINIPYIKSESRPRIEKVVIPLGEELVGPGELNFAITSLLLSYLGVVPDHDGWITITDPSYTSFNEVVGVLECVKQELYRRRIAQYEDEKIKTHGDVY